MKLVLISVILSLGALLALEWIGWPPPPVPPPQTAGKEADAPGAAPGAESPLDALSSPEDKEQYAVVSERPLFRPDRRPAPEGPEAEQEPAPAEDAELSKLDLNAVIITPAKAIAWVRDPAETKLRDLELGDELKGWTVKEILVDRLVLERQGETDTLTLRDYQNTTPAPSTPLRQAPRTPQRAGEPPPRVGRGRPAPGRPPNPAATGGGPPP